MPAPLSSLTTSPTCRVRYAGFFLLCLSIIWLGLGGHPFSDRSEGRYAVVSMNMAEGGSWLVPTWGGKPHLTKPPLTYWLEAGCLHFFGRTEFAVRLPSAVAGSLTILALLGLMWRIRGCGQAILATAVLAVMPMFAVMSRLTLTDSLLNLFWFGALAAGLLAIREPARRRWPMLLWLSVALGLITKGPLAWVPVGLILLWLGLGRRWREKRALRLPLGMALSLLPLAGWVAGVLYFQPAAIKVWWFEMAVRVSGATAPHPKPWWYFLPIFMGGLFPATVILMVPGLNYSWRTAWAALRRGEEACLWALAVVVPLIMFSCIRGKLPSYLLPLCAPLAILTAGVLTRCLRQGETLADDHPQLRGETSNHDDVRSPMGWCHAHFRMGMSSAAMPSPAQTESEWVKLPRTADAFCIAAAAIGTASVLFMLAPSHWLTLGVQWVLTYVKAGTLAPGAMDFVRTACFWLLPTGLILAAAGAWFRWAWQNRPAHRIKVLAGLWIAFVLFYLAAFTSENRLQTPTGDPAMLAALTTNNSIHRPKLVTCGIIDSTLTFYNDRPTPPANGPDALRRLLSLHPNDLVVYAEGRSWQGLAEKDPALAREFETVMTWHVWMRDQPRLLLRPIASVRAAAPATTQRDEAHDDVDPDENQ